MVATMKSGMVKKKRSYGMVGENGTVEVVLTYELSY